MPNRLRHRYPISKALPSCALILFAFCAAGCHNTVIPKGDGEYMISDDAGPNEGSAAIIERLKAEAQEYCRDKGYMEFLSSAGSDRPGTPSGTVHFRCGSKNQPTSEPTPVTVNEELPATVKPVIAAEPLPPAMPVGGTYRLIVSFNSFASGTDPVVVAKMDALIAALEKKIQQPVERKRKNWGREGEFNYCFKLAEMDSAQREAFVKEVKAQLGSSDRAAIQENGTCD